MMVTFGYLRLGVSLLLILGWAIFAQSLCVPKSLLAHASGSISTSLITVASSTTITSKTTSYSVITALQTIPVDTLVTIATTTAVTVASPITLVSQSVSASTWTVGGNTTFVSSWVISAPQTHVSSSTTTLASTMAAHPQGSPGLPATPSSVHPQVPISQPGRPSPSPPISTIPVGGATQSQSSSSASGISQPSGGSQPMDGAIDGEASFYTSWNDHKGSCGFIPTDPYIAAANPQFMPAKCNQCAMVSYQGKQIKVKITDTCPECPANKLDLSDFAFKQLEDPIKGIIKIQWKWVAC